MRKVRTVSALAAAALLAAAPPAEAARTGGTATLLAAGDVDYLDPGQTYYAFGYQVQLAVNRPLYAFRPGDATPVGDLAAGPPEISADRRTIVVRLRPGVRYAPPVAREVRAADVEYAIERAFSANVANGYAFSFFGELEGAPSRPGPLRDIAGVTATDDATLVLRLTAPVADRVAAALVMPITVPVPREHAAAHDARSPTTYDRDVAFTGPYVAARRPGRSIELSRNPSWDPATDFRPAYLDAITIDEGNLDLTAAARRALSGDGLMCCDTGQPPARVLRDALRERPAQVQRIPAGGTRWIAFNTRVKPFDRLAVRRAAVAGLDRRALLATRGGAVAGRLASHFLPPGMPGFAESGGPGGFRDLDFLSRPSGSRSLARSYLRRAGHRRGRYAGRRALLMIATKAQPGRRTARLAARQLRRLGFPIRVRHVGQSALHARWCGRPSKRWAICANVGWFKDFDDPEAMLKPTFSGAAIRPAGNVNWSQLRVPAIDRAMEDAAALPAGPGRYQAWAAINHDVAAQAPGAPYVWDDAYALASADLEAPMNPYTAAADLSFTGLR